MKQLSLLDVERQRDPARTDAECIADIAARVIDEVGEEPPVQLPVVASFRDIADIRVEALPTAASLTPEEAGLVMRLRADDSRRRRRFSGFHEVGHTFLPGYYDQVSLRCLDPHPARRDEQDPEALADIAASELLFPRDHFRPDVMRSNFGFESIVAMADIYDASIQATTYRFADFWPDPCLVLALESGLRKEERDDPDAVAKLRVVSAWPEPAGEWPFIPRNKSVSDDGCLVRAFEGEVIDEPASLSELDIAGPGGLQLSARSFVYRHPKRGPRRRVLAIFRKSRSHG